MRSFGFRLPAFVAILWAGIGSTAWALGFHDTVETVYLMPSTTAVAVPTSYVVASSWVQPTAYVLPRYSPTAYWADPVELVPSSYVTTARVRRGLLGRTRVVERSAVAGYGTTYLPTSYATYLPTSYATYLPTSYSVTPVSRTRSYSYIPTVLDYPVVWESAYVVPPECVCPEMLASAAVPPRPASSGTTSARGSGSSRVVPSEPADEGAMSSDVGPPPGSAAGGGAGGGGSRAATGGTGQQEQAQPYPKDLPPVRDNTPPPPAASPPQPPTAEQQGRPSQPGTPATTTTKPAPGGAAGLQTEAQKGSQSAVTNPNPTRVNPNPARTPVQPPVAPGGTPGELNPVPAEGTTTEPRHEVRRPADLSRTVRSFSRNVLTGIVQSSASGEPEEGVRLTLTYPSDRRLNKATATDAYGRFAVRLADGDWTVNVTMPSGRVYAVSQLRVSDGQITDSQGRRIPSLEITR